MAEQTLPTPAALLVKPDGRPDETWYQRFSQMWAAFNGARSDIDSTDESLEELETDVAALEADVEALEALTTTLGTYTALTSTITTLTGIPSNAKMVVLNIVGASLDNTAALRIRIGPSGGVATSGYLGSNSFISTGGNPVGNNYTAGIDFTTGVGATGIYHGQLIFTLADAATNTWTIGGGVGRSDSATPSVTYGSVPLSGALERISITTVAATAAFDAGSVSVLVQA
jgi:hypothetical protein